MANKMSVEFCPGLSPQFIKRPNEMELLAAAVELAVEDLFPGAEVQLTVRDCDDDLAAPAR